MARTTAQEGRRTPASRLSAQERRRQLAETAAQLFYRRGFHQVALADVATAVGVTAPAVYRHFRNKNALLAGALEGGLDVADAAFTAAEDGSLDDLLFSLAGAALDRRDVWVLLQREMRHLDGEEYSAIHARFGAFVSRLSARVRRARPDVDGGQLTLLVTAVLATLASPSVSGQRVRREEYQRVLTAAAAAAARAELPAPGGQTRSISPEPDDAGRSRSEELFETAITLFHERGYAAVSLDDIGAAVGLAGPSIYHHFETKSELLVTAFTRAAQRLPTYRHGAGADATPRDLIRGYIEVGVQQRHLFGVYVTEAINLPPDARRRIRDELHADIDEWSSALLRQRPELTATGSLVLVYAARGVVNDVVRVGGLHARPRIDAELEALLLAVLSAKYP